MEKWKWVGHWACVLAGSAQAQHITWAESRTPRCPLLSLPALAHNRATELEPNLLPIHACAVLACLLRCAAQALALPREITAAGPSHTRPFPHPLLFCTTSLPLHLHLSTLPPPPPPSIPSTLHTSRREYDAPPEEPGPTISCPAIPDHCCSALERERATAPTKTGHNTKRGRDFHIRHNIPDLREIFNSKTTSTLAYSSPPGSYCL
ncbi:uncharacterized protein K444DRAFT_85073 [Hyaloscypha bicolor E]|uniref:Hydrophobin n=1 Tax=Hyaloscypha bicolor E TaxID=1095630 RepID=A0A2J6SYW9_9HELO|nr:uncharacterized protein K444DRAFT_85073 [Hyaloscypha bicolor E]PMD55952.1 hypothetical protein K444DRAFT_85073 [Hyaloscypha bicolor E]